AVTGTNLAKCTRISAAVGSVYGGAKQLKFSVKPVKSMQGTKKVIESAKTYYANPLNGMMLSQYQEFAELPAQEFAGMMLQTEATIEDVRFKVSLQTTDAGLPTDEMVKDGVITTIIGEKFLIGTVPQVTMTNNGTSVSLTKVNTPSLTVNQYRVEKSTCDGLVETPTNLKSCDKIIANVGLLYADTATFSYYIKLKDPFASGTLPVNTATQSTLEFKDNLNVTKKLTYPLATVNVTAVTDTVKVNFDKKASEVGKDLYEVAFDINGEIDANPGQNARIVIALDTSSGNTRLAEMKTEVKVFLQRVITRDGAGRITVNIITFDSNANNASGNFSRNLVSLETSVNNIALSAKPQREFSAAYRFGSTQLDTGNASDPTALRYLIVLGGGLPTGTNPKVDTTKAYEDITTGTNAGKNQVYTTGLLKADAPIADQVNAFSWFATWQNIVDPLTYRSIFYPNDTAMTTTAGINTALSKVADSVLGRTYDIFTYKANLVDVIDSRFEVVPNSWKITGITSAFTVTHTTGSEDKLEVYLGAIPQYNQSNGINKVKVTFQIRPRDSYYGATGVATNVGDAKLGYINPLTNQTNERKKATPYIDLGFKSGKITIEKVNPEATQEAYIVRVGSDSNKMSVNVPANSANSVEFYLKQATTDITPNSDYKKNYIEVGDYDISELVPQNEAIESIEYAYDSDSVTPGIQGEYQAYTIGDKVKIDKDNSQLYIRVTNKTTNTKYLHAADQRINQLLFK
ncbi:MAG: hypothetical protein ACRC5Q_00970, partial [Culicoidibacterales bacterium]